MNTPVHLTIMQPPGYVHSQGFLDQARYVRYQFRRMGCEVSIAKNRLREDAVNIIFGAHLGFSSDLKNRFICVFFNLEQLGEGGMPVNHEYLNLLKSSAVIDYDNRNLAAYGCQPGEIPVVSFASAPYLFPDAPIPLESRPIDLLFFGSLNERRRSLITRIEACGYKVTTFSQPLYGEERDDFIRHSKSVLNCHFYESSRFEQARAFHALSLGTPIVSERTPNTHPPSSFENSVTWFTDETLEDFFSHQFTKISWFDSARQNLDNFTEQDSLQSWQTAWQFCQAFQTLDSSVAEDRAIWVPSVMNLGSGKDYKLGWLNIDILLQAQPDVVLNLGEIVDLPLRMSTLGGGQLELNEGQFDHIYANNVLEHVPDLPCLMGNLLRLLKSDGVLEVEVPYEKAPSAWQDPTHLRAMNKSSWLYYTDWFWYLGWFHHRFEISSFNWLDSHHQNCEEPYAAFMRVKFRKIETSIYEKTIARSYRPDFGGIPED